jgi:hypothetical protein
LVVPTDQELAKLVGASEDIGDAHVVAVCAAVDAAVVITSDRHDITQLATAIPCT